MRTETKGYTHDRTLAWSLTVVLFCCWTPGVALGDTITVSKGGSISTIQAGVDAAGPGDLIQVKKGVYQENVVIAAGLNGLTLQAIGKGRVTIEARAAGGAGSGPGISVDSSNVSIKGVIVQNAKGDGGSLLGFGIQSTQPGLTVKNCTIAACRDGALKVTSGDNTTVIGCSLFGNLAGIQITGNDVSVSESRVQDTGGDGIVISGDRATISKCWLENSSDSALILTGDQGELVRLTVTGTGADGILINGTGVTISKCFLASIDGVALNVTGDDAELSRNRVTAAQGDGIRLVGDGALVELNKLRRVANASCIAVSGSGFSIQGNTCREATGESRGITVSNAGSGTIADNDSALLSQVAIDLAGTCSNLLVDGNKVLNNGNSDDDGFRIRGSGHTVSNNLAVNCSRDGFKVEGNSITLTNNKAIRNGQDGIDVESGTGVVLDGNKAVGNRAEGIENNANGTAITSNTSSGNRIDFANSGSGVTFTGNQSGDGSDENTSPEID